MTTYKKPDPTGLDEVIQWIQDSIEEIGWSNTAIYGKLYVNERLNGKVAEAYVSSGEYSEVFVDDTKNAVFGFIVDGKRRGYTMIKTTARLICSINLDKIYSNLYRNDEEVMRTIVRAIDIHLLGEKFIEISTDLSEVFSGLSIDRFKFRDMHPWFNFSITFELTYKN